ncbi:MAG: DUF6033 family protein [Clostridiales bacterium]|nr:DUF6033 family protein [Clostridiales bacterium]
MAMEISSAYNSYASTYTNGADGKKQTESKAATKTDKANSSSAAKASTSDYLAELQKKNPKLNIQSGYANASIGSGSYPNKIDVTIAPNILAEMETNPETAEKWEKALAGIPAAANWAASTINAMTGNKMLYIHYWVDENGNMGACSASGPSPDEVGKMISERKKQQEEQLEARLEAGKERRERMEKLAEKKAEKKEQEEKLTEQREKEKTEKKTLQMREAKIAGNDVKTLTEKLVVTNATSSNSAVSGTIGVDIKI